MCACRCVREKIDIYLGVGMLSLGEGLLQYDNLCPSRLCLVREGWREEGRKRGGCLPVYVIDNLSSLTSQFFSLTHHSIHILSHLTHTSSPSSTTVITVLHPSHSYLSLLPSHSSHSHFTSVTHINHTRTHPFCTFLSLLYCVHTSFNSIIYSIQYNTHSS